MPGFYCKSTTKGLPATEFLVASTKSNSPLYLTNEIKSKQMPPFLSLNTEMGSTLYKKHEKHRQLCIRIRNGLINTSWINCILKGQQVKFSAESLFISFNVNNGRRDDFIYAGLAFESAINNLFRISSLFAAFPAAAGVLAGTDVHTVVGVPDT
jgi:hypothetical protein